MSERLWYCTRQRAGPLVKECRALRPRLSANDSPWERREKNAIIRSPHSAVCRTQADRLELRLALFGYEGSHYTLTFDALHLPKNFDGVRASFRAFRERAKRWRKDAPFDWIGCIEGKHGDHRYHIHTVLRDSDFSPAEVRYLWRQGNVDDEPVLLKKGGYRRLAEYFNKESTDGFIIPIGKHPWSCSRSLVRKLEKPERWRDASGVIEIPDDVLFRPQPVSHQNAFGSYYYVSYIYKKNSAFILNQ